MSEDGRRVGLALLGHLEKAWKKPDEGIWEVRGGSKHFVHSKVMAWVAFDRACGCRNSPGRGLGGAGRPLAGDPRRDPRRGLREGIRPGAKQLRPVLRREGPRREPAAHRPYRLPPQHDPRVVGTVEAIGKGLMREGFILRYETAGQTTDGLSGNEGAFLPCTFWYADNLIGLGRRDEARTLIERLIGICTISASSAKSTTCTPSVLWVTSRRRSPTWPWSTRSSAMPMARGRRRSRAVNRTVRPPPFTAARRPSGRARE